MVHFYVKNRTFSNYSILFSLILHWFIRVAVVNKITDFLLFLGTFMVTAGVVLVAFFFYVFAQDYAVTSFIATDVISIPNTSYYWVIIIVSSWICDNTLLWITCVDGTTICNMMWVITNVNEYTYIFTKQLITIIVNAVKASEYATKHDQVVVTSVWIFKYCLSLDLQWQLHKWQLHAISNHSHILWYVITQHSLAEFLASPLQNPSPLQANTRYYVFPFQLIGIGTFVVSKLFFGVFDMAVDTLFLCFRKLLYKILHFPCQLSPSICRGIPPSTFFYSI